MYEKKRVFLPLSTWNRKPKVAISGYTDVGRTLHQCMTECDSFVNDNTFGVTIDNMLDFNPDLVFICHDPVIHEESGRQDASQVEDDFLKVMRRSKAAVVLTTPVTPDIMERMCNTIEDPEDVIRFMYWPNLLVRDVDMSLRNLAFSVLGARQDAVNEFRHFLNLKTDIIFPAPIILNPVECAYVACSIHNYAAVKNILFNELISSIENDVNGKAAFMSTVKTLMSNPTIGRAYARDGVIGGEHSGLSETTKNMVTAYSNFTPYSDLFQAALNVDNELKNNVKEKDDEFVDHEQTEEKQ